jgi:hypothetical protein
MSRRRTLKKYETLYRDRTSLFPNVETVLWPNGKPEIWFKTPDGLGFRVRVSNGPAGLGVNVQSFVGTPNMSDAYGNDDFDVELCQYRQDARSQAFKRWYRKQETEADITLLGETYRR